MVPFWWCRFLASGTAATLESHSITVDLLVLSRVRPNRARRTTSVQQSTQGRERRKQASVDWFVASVPLSLRVVVIIIVIGVAAAVDNISTMVADLRCWHSIGSIFSHVVIRLRCQRAWFCWFLFHRSMILLLLVADFGSPCWFVELRLFSTFEELSFCPAWALSFTEVVVYHSLRIPFSSLFELDLRMVHVRLIGGNLLWFFAWYETLATFRTVGCADA